MFKIRNARGELPKSLEIIDAYYKRLDSFYKNNFKFEKKYLEPHMFSLEGLKKSTEEITYNELLNGNFHAAELVSKKISPESYYILLTQRDLDKFIQLKNEFEQEYLITKKYADILNYNHGYGSSTGTYDWNM